MEEAIIRILTEELNYKPETAEVTCRDLMAVQDPEIRQALAEWVETRKMTPVSAEGFDAVALTRRMRYPSALLAIDMLKKEPERARKLLRGFR